MVLKEIRGGTLTSANSHELADDGLHMPFPFRRAGGAEDTSGQSVSRLGAPRMRYILMFLRTLECTHSIVRSRSEFYVANSSGSGLDLTNRKPTSSLFASAHASS